ncbi:hypothetical protein PG985_011442 [Apiospora marii]|uniref:Uncharacterized protein n=1 Tax=Apiospora marii TaxID=335849 RepID=A0ABR1SV21_9PEZI
MVSLGGSRGFHIDQFGLNISLPAIPVPPPLGKYCAPLRVGSPGVLGKYALFLHRYGETEYARVSSRNGESSVTTQYESREFVDFKVPLVVTAPLVQIYPGFWLRKLSYDQSAYRVDRLERAWTVEHDRMRLPDDRDGTVGIIQLDGPLGVAWIKAGFGPNFEPVCGIIRPTTSRYDSAIHYMRTHSVDLLQTPPRSVERWDHPIFDENWMRPAGQALPGIPDDAYDCRLATGSFEQGLDMAYNGSRFDISVSVQRVPDMEQRDRHAPAEVWALDIDCRKTTPHPAESYGCCSC